MHGSCCSLLLGITDEAEVRRFGRNGAARLTMSGYSWDENVRRSPHPQNNRDRLFDWKRERMNKLDGKIPEHFWDLKMSQWRVAANRKGRVGGRIA
jgi:hypothetical protein